MNEELKREDIFAFTNLLKVDDYVVLVTEEFGRESRSLQIVTRRTDKRIQIDTGQLFYLNGREYGSMLKGSFKYRIEPIIESQKEQLMKDRILSQIKTFDFTKFSLNKLLKIKSICASNV